MRSASTGISGATNDLEVWVSISPENTARIDRALRGFGFAAAGLTFSLFLIRNNVVHMGTPIRIEILTSVSGVEFESLPGRTPTYMLDGKRYVLVAARGQKPNKRLPLRRDEADALESFNMA
jgi:hypothetical protein